MIALGVDVPTCPAIGEGWRCDRTVDVAGLCEAHYQQRYHGRSFTPPRPKRPRLPSSPGPCQGPNCSRPVRRIGRFCQAHYQQYATGRELRPIGSRSRLARNERGEKCCSKCRQWLPVSAFWQSRGVVDGLASACKPCVTAGRTKLRHGLSVIDKAALYLAQGSVCAICGLSPKKVCVDHAHACCPGRESCENCRRGLLCPSCNFALGQVKDDPTILHNMIAYLNKWENRSTVA